MPLSAPASGGSIAFNNQTGAAYTLAASDAGNWLTMNNAGANTVTVPKNSTTALPVGQPFNVQQIGAGQTSIAAAAGVTINTASTLNARAQNSVLVLVQESTDNWTLTGDFA